VSGQWTPFFTLAEEEALALAPMLRRRQERPIVAPSDWSPL